MKDGMQYIGVTLQLPGYAIWLFILIVVPILAYPVEVPVGLFKTVERQLIGR